jgi:cysteine synthase
MAPQVGLHRAPTGSANVLGLIGNTPLVELQRLVPRRGVRLLAKLESHNPSGSGKDRIALPLIEEAERRGLIRPGDTVMEPTSGNTGIALAMICRLKGYRLVAVMPENATPERTAMLRLYGAEIIFTDGARGSTGAIEVAQRLSVENGLYMPFQYGNLANPAAHYHGTAGEILRDCPEVDVFVAGIGTGGTLMGCGQRFRSHRHNIAIVGCEPVPGDHISGLRSLSDGFIPPVLHLSQLDQRLLVSSDDAIAMTRRLATEEGIFAGPSSGAVVHTCVRIAETIDRGTIVGIIFDGGWKYISSSMAVGRAGERTNPDAAHGALDLPLRDNADLG